jgi:hypothetical protein
MWQDENLMLAGMASPILLVSFITKAKDDAGNETYVNLGIAPLIKDFLRTPFSLISSLDDHRFSAYSDNPVLILDHGHFRCPILGYSEMYKFPKGYYTLYDMEGDPPSSDIVYRYYKLEIEQVCQYIISNGKLRRNPKNITELEG